MFVCLLLRHKITRVRCHWSPAVACQCWQRSVPMSHIYCGGVQTSAKLTGAATPGLAPTPHPPTHNPPLPAAGQLTRIVRIKFFIWPRVSRTPAKISLWAPSAKSEMFQLGSPDFRQHVNERELFTVTTCLQRYQTTGQWSLRDQVAKTSIVCLPFLWGFSSAFFVPDYTIKWSVNTWGVFWYPWEHQGTLNWCSVYFQQWCWDLTKIWIYCNIIITLEMWFS